MKKMTRDQLVAAVELLEDQLKQSQTIFAQIFNWPDNPDNAILVQNVFMVNKVVLSAVDIKFQFDRVQKGKKL
jgi:hypothetical protein